MQTKQNTLFQLPLVLAGKCYVQPFFYHLHWSSKCTFATWRLYICILFTSLRAKTLFQWLCCFKPGKEYQVFPKCIPSREKLLLNKSALKKSRSQQKSITGGCFFAGLWLLPLNHTYCTTYVREETYCSHVSYFMGATQGLQLGWVRGDAQIGALLAILCIFWRAGGKPICLCQLNQDSQKFGGCLAVEESPLGINPTGQSLQIPFTVLLSMLT